MARRLEALVRPDRPGLSPALRGALLGSLLAGGPGCVHTYQPMSGLHRPVVVDTGVANFEDLRLAIYCPPGDHLNASEAASLCRKVGMLFENQGAEVTTATRDRRLQDRASDAVAAEGEDGEPPTDLVLELRTREHRRSNDALSWLLCLGTFTLVPAVSETTFAQDVVIRDGTGFLLVSDTLRGRIVRNFGAGTWLGNKLLDTVWRDKEDELTGDVARRELSADLYGQLSQLVFNAKMRWQVMQVAPAAVGQGTR